MLSLALSNGAKRLIYQNFINLTCMGNFMMCCDMQSGTNTQCLLAVKSLGFPYISLQTIFNYANT